MNAFPPNQLSPSETECPPDSVGAAASAANANAVNSRSCSRCGSVSSNKSNKTTASHHSVCHETTHNEPDAHTEVTYPCCNGTYNGESDAEHQYFVNNVSHRSSMSHIPADMTSYGSYNSLSHRSRTPVPGEGGSGNTHKHGHYHYPQTYQYHYQPHHTSCKKVMVQDRSRCRHRRKSSSSTLPDSLVHRRADTDSSSVRGSESCIYEPLHVDVSSPSTANNTVILTPSKITIERNQNEHGPRETTNGDYHEFGYQASPIDWQFPPPPEPEPSTSGRGNKTAARDTDFIEVVAEPEDIAPRDDKDVKKFTYDSKTISVWRTDNEETTNTVIYHHETESVDNCCENYYFHCKAEGEIDNCSAVPCELMPISGTMDCCEYTNSETDDVPAKHSESLNNMVAVASHPTTPLINFQKNNISSLTHRLDLSPEVRRYSKFTNLQQQNDTNLTPHHFPVVSGESNGNANGQHRTANVNQNLGCNYFADDKFVNTSVGSRDATHQQQSQQQHQQQQQQQQPQPTTQPQQQPHSSNQATSSFYQHSPGQPLINSESMQYLQTNSNTFELFNISNSALYEKPFGSINLTTQNQFEPFSNRRQSGNNNMDNGDLAARRDDRQSGGGGGAAAGHTMDRRPYAANDEAMASGGASGSDINNPRDDADADGDNNNHEDTTRDESLMSRLLTRRNPSVFGNVFRAVRKRARKFTDDRKDT